MTTTKPRQFKVGESGWEVEWCSQLAYQDPEHPEDGIDPDQCVYEFRNFRTRDAAMAFAREIFPNDQFGSVRITPFTIEALSDTWPHGRSQQFTADSEFYEGEPQS